MKILSFDTCFSKTHIILSENETILSKKIAESDDTTYHSVHLLPMIVEILKEQNLSISDLDAIGINIGPGSFTGIRISATVARVFAQQANLKLVGIPSLQILSKINTTKENSTIILDARKNKVYFAVYDKNNNVIQEPMLLDKDELIHSINTSSNIISDLSIGKFLKENKVNFVNFEEYEQNIGEYLMLLTNKILNENPNNDFNFAKLKPLYIQPPSISKPKESKINVL